MDIYIHIEKKHLYALIAVLVISFGMFFVLADHGNGNPPLINTPVYGVSHHLQEIVKNDVLVGTNAPKTSVDIDNNGVIDSSDACNGEDTCIMNLTRFTPQNPGAPTLGQIWIRP